MAALGGRDSIALIADADGNPIGFCTVYLDILSVRFGQCSCIGPGLAAAVGWVQRLSQ
jgi:hypothetical protein